MSVGKKIGIIGMVAVLGFGNIVGMASAQSVSGIRSVNNEYQEVGLSMNLEKVANKFNVASSVKEVFGDSSERTLDHNLNDLGLKNPHHLNWLFNSNLSTERDVSFSDNNIAVGGIPNLHIGVNSLKDPNRSDFLMFLYQSVYGPIESRSISFKVPSKRLAGEEYVYKKCEVDVNDVEICKDYIAYRDPVTMTDVSDGRNYKVVLQGETQASTNTFSEGDYYFYTSINVKELYLSQLLSKGLIDISTIADIEFRELYKGDGIPSWNSDLPTFPMGYSDRNDTKTLGISGGTPLGRSFNITGVSAGSLGGPSDFVISYENNPYLIDESLSTIDAFRFIEKFIRATEKDMTKTEARIVSYKYGMNYLDRNSPEDVETLMFLTAKGILNFEEDNEYKNLNLALDAEFMYTLLYRVANVDARMNFSEIQLTDNDNFWINKGYSQSRFEISEIEGDSFPDVTTIDVQLVPLETSMVNGYRRSTLATGTGVYDVTKQFEDPSKYFFLGKKASELDESDPYVKQISKTPNGLAIRFEVAANSPIHALQLIDSNIVVDSSAYIYRDGLMSVSKVHKDGVTTTLVPAESLKLLSFGGTKIEILEDKVLRNSSTGATAILLPDNDLALVGSHVVNSEDLMVTSVTGEVYYSLEIIRTLLPNLYISQLDRWSMYVTSGLENESVMKIKSEDLNTIIGATYSASFKTFPEANDPSGTDFRDNDFVSLSHLGNISNTVIKDFTVVDSFGDEIEFKLIMHFRFQLPKEEIGFVNPLYTNSDPTHSDIHKFIYEAPKDPELLDLWDNNKGISNGLLNAVYGSSGIDYVKTGWLTPTLHIIYDNTVPNQISLLKEFFVEAGNEIPESWYKRFMGVDKSVANSVVTGEGEELYNTGSKFYPEKTLTVGMFPRWVHAMFNNGTSEPSLSPDYVGTWQSSPPTVSGVKYNNTLMWRTMMDNRTLVYQSSITVGRGFKAYSMGDYEYVVSNGGNVYMKVDAHNLFMSIVNHTTSGMYGNTSEKVLALKTRTEDNRMQSKVGKIVTYGNSGDKFFVNTVFADYIKVTDLAKLTGTPTFDAGDISITGRVIYSSGGQSSPMKNVELNRYRDLVALINKPAYIGYESILGDFGVGGSTYSDIGNRTESPYLLKQAASKGIGDSFPIAFSGSSGFMNYRELESLGRVNGYISFLLPRDKFTITETDRIYARKTYPQLNISSIYVTSITKNVIDATIMNYNGTIKLEEVPVGAKVRMGDLEFTRTGKGFTSDPIKSDSTARTVIASPKDNNKLVNWTRGRFAGFNIRIAGTVDSSLANYVEYVKLGSKDSINLSNEKTLGSDNGVSSVFHINQSGAIESRIVDDGNTIGVDSISVEIQFREGLVVRKSSINATYELLYYSSEFAEGMVDNLPFFNEDLSLGTTSFDTLIGDPSKSIRLNGADELRNGLIQYLKFERDRGVYGFVKSLFIYFILLVLSLTFIIFTVGIIPMAMAILENFGHRRNGKEDIDLFSKVSFGLFDYNNKMNFVHFILILFVGLVLMGSIVVYA